MQWTVNITTELVLRLVGILAALVFLPGLLMFGWDAFLCPVLSIHPISYFNACAGLSFLAFVLVVVVSFVVVIKELV